MKNYKKLCVSAIMWTLIALFICALCSFIHAVFFHKPVIMGKPADISYTQAFEGTIKILTTEFGLVSGSALAGAIIGLLIGLREVQRSAKKLKKKE